MRAQESHSLFNRAAPAADALAQQEQQRRSEWAERRRREAFEQEALAEYEADDAPATVKCDCRGMPPARARLARYVVWRNRTKGELAALEATAEKLKTTIAAPQEVTAKRDNLLKQQAKRLLECIGLGEASEPAEFDVVQARHIDGELASAEHKSRVAATALENIERQLDAKRLQVARLAERERSFLVEALRERADGLGARYLKAVQGLRSVATEIAGLDQYLGGRPKTIDLPTFSLPSLRNADLSIVADTDAAAPWRKVADSWLKGAT